MTEELKEQLNKKPVFLPRLVFWELGKCDPGLCDQTFLGITEELRALVKCSRLEITYHSFSYEKFLVVSG